MSILATPERARATLRRGGLVLACLIAAMPGSGSAAAPGAGTAADCQGHDLFPDIERNTPSAYRALQDEAGRKPFRFGKLFAISQPGRPVSYVFGTLHLSDPRLTSITRRLQPIIGKAHMIVLELASKTLRRSEPGAPNDRTLEAASQALPGEQADHLLTSALFAELQVALTARHVAPSLAGTLNAGVLALMLDTPACSPAQPDPASIDAGIAAMANAAAIPTFGLETPAEQIAAFQGLSASDNRRLLVSALVQSRSQADIRETEIARYGEGDLGALVAWVTSASLLPGEPLAATPPVFFDRLIRLRNRRFLDRLYPLLRHGNVFVAVGADHLPGDDGLLQLLKRSGFDVVETHL